MYFFDGVYCLYVFFESIFKKVYFRMLDMYNCKVNMIYYMMQKSVVQIEYLIIFLI